MRLSLGQHQQQRQLQQQKMVLAPRMIQSMEILQLPITALQERIERELEENAVLEVDETPAEDVLPEPAAEEETPPPDVPTEEERELVIRDDSDNAEDFQRLESVAERIAEFNDDFDDRPRVSSNRREELAQRDHDLMANAVGRPRSLQDYLLEQLGYFDLEPRVREMAERIIGSLDSSGRLPVPLEDLVPAEWGKQGRRLAEEALKIVQRLDPPGVAARDLRECLLLQLTPEMPYYQELRTLIADHLDDLLHNRLPAIQRKTDYTLEQLQGALEQLRKLNPRPGAEFEYTPTAPVTPDVYVEKDEQGRWRVRLEDERIPRLYIRQDYRRMLENGTADEKVREYIRRKINAAQWLIDSIEQRRSTLLKVAQAIVDHQKDFLEKGPEFIHPLKMQQIADRVGVHVTTVSRAVDDKWIQTPRGIFPLKRFFVGGTSTDAGEEVAWDVVRIKLQEIIDNEDKSNPLSDDDLAKELAKHGIKVARRTVTKYRKAMNIPSSRQRRNWALAQKQLKNAGKKDGR